MSFEFPSFQLWTESQGTQTIQLIVSFLKRPWSVDVNIYWIFYILSMLCFACYCVHIFTVCSNSSYFNVYYLVQIHSETRTWHDKNIQSYLSICVICSYQLLHIVLAFDFLYILFYKQGVFFGQSQYVFFSLRSCQWYAESMILLYDTNNDVEENRGNVSLRALVYEGMKNFSVDL